LFPLGFANFWIVTLDGQQLAASPLHRLRNPKGTITHVIGSEEEGLGLTADDVARLEEIEAADRAAKLATPEGQRAALVTAREDAVSKWSIANVSRRGADEVARAEAVMEEAVEAVEEFDAAHPLVATLEQREEDREVLRGIDWMREHFSHDWEDDDQQSRVQKR
jgi:hypothetical protein